MSAQSPFLAALLTHKVDSRVVDFDHYRAGVAVDTDYIISVTPKGHQSTFEPFQYVTTTFPFISVSVHLENEHFPHTRRLKLETLTDSPKHMLPFASLRINL